MDFDGAFLIVHFALVESTIDSFPVPRPVVLPSPTITAIPRYEPGQEREHHSAVEKIKHSFSGRCPNRSGIRIAIETHYDVMAVPEKSCQLNRSMQHHLIS